MTAYRSLLLDFDGVILRNDPAFALVRKKAVSFISKHHCLNDAEAQKLNNHLYSEYGHTVLGLHETFKVRYSCKKTLMKNFNNHIYDDKLFTEIHKLPINKVAIYQGIEARLVVDYARRNHMGTFIFTNAPVKWVQFGLLLLGQNGLFRPEEIISADEYDFVKPQPELYNIVHNELGLEQKITFIDDSNVNIINAPNKWDSHLFEQNESLPDLIAQGFI